MSHTHTHTHSQRRREGRLIPGKGKKGTKKEFMKIDNKPGVCTMEQ
jgi:hypothetical protein